jgi:hypothetical protein
MKNVLIRSDVEWRVTEHGVKHCVKALYIRVTEESLTMSASTAQAAWITYQLGSLVVTLIV